MRSHSPVTLGGLVEAFQFLMMVCLGVFFVFFTVLAWNFGEYVFGALFVVAAAVAFSWARTIR